MALDPLYQRCASTVPPTRPLTVNRDAHFDPVPVNTPYWLYHNFAPVCNPYLNHHIKSSRRSHHQHQRTASVPVRNPYLPAFVTPNVKSPHLSLHNSEDSEDMRTRSSAKETKR